MLKYGWRAKPAQLNLGCSRSLLPRLPPRHSRFSMLSTLFMQSKRTLQLNIRSNVRDILRPMKPCILVTSACVVRQPCVLMKWLIRSPNLQLSVAISLRTFASFPSLSNGVSQWSSRARTKQSWSFARSCLDGMRDLICIHHIPNLLSQEDNQKSVVG